MCQASPDLGLRYDTSGLQMVARAHNLRDTIEELRAFSAKDTKEALEFLLREVYIENKIDFSRLSTLELAMKHPWMNFRQNPEASVLFYTPPSTSYAVRARVEIHEQGPYWEYVNLVHDVYHMVGQRKERDWQKTPAYFLDKGDLQQ